jgi:hypothetical protein
MEQQKEQLPPLTPKQREAEAAYAKEIFQRTTNPTPEMRRDLSEKMKRHFNKRKAASLVNQASK